MAGFITSGHGQCPTVTKNINIGNGLSFEHTGPTGPASLDGDDGLAGATGPIGPTGPSGSASESANQTHMGQVPLEE